MVGLIVYNQFRVNLDPETVFCIILCIRVVAKSLPLQIALPAKGAPKYTILGCLLATGALYLVKNSLRQKYSPPPLPPPYISS